MNVRPILRWDGSDLGYLSLDEVDGQIDCDYGYFLRIRDSHESYVAKVYKGKGTEECIFDEMKEIFSLNKIGTHRAKIRTLGSVLLARCHTTKDFKIRLDFGLGEITDIENLPKKTLSQIFRFLLFYDLVCASSVKKNYIRLIGLDNGEIVVTTSLSAKLSYRSSELLLKVVEDRWCPKGFDHNIETELIFGPIRKEMDISIKLLAIRKQVNEIINRIDKSCIAHVQNILEKIRIRLTLAIS